MFSCVFLCQVQVEDETTLNEVPCDLSRFHAQLRDHSPLDRRFLCFFRGVFGSPPGEDDNKDDGYGPWISMDL